MSTSLWTSATINQCAGGFAGVEEWVRPSAADDHASALADRWISDVHTEAGEASLDRRGSRYQTVG